MDSMQTQLFSHPDLRDHWLARELLPILLSPTGVSSVGYPYLERPAYQRLRDWVPYLLCDGVRVLDAVAKIRKIASQLGYGEEPFPEASRVVGQVVRTAAITAPSDLWLLREVLKGFASQGWLTRLRAGEWIDVTELGVEAREVLVDFDFLLSRGFLVKQEACFRASNHPTSQQVWQGFTPSNDGAPSDLASIWAAAFAGETLGEGEVAWLTRSDGTTQTEHRPPAWVPTLWDIEWGSRLLGLVLGLRAAGHSAEVASMDVLPAADLLARYPQLVSTMETIAAVGGLVTETGRITPVGRRVLQRGPGPMGIVAAYSPYMDCLEQIWQQGRGVVHVQRGANIAASQDANRKTFAMANDALDRFCADTGFQYSVYIEHALGKGEATRQRFERSGDAQIRFVGADLEWAAVQAAESERSAGRLPAEMALLGGMDIGAPQKLLDAIRGLGLPTEGSVMIVGNGFHEVREQTDEKLMDVFAAYERAGVVLLFTEESALSTADLLETAWNTYHAGFRYVHERSGQGLRPAQPGPPPLFGEPIRASWKECAERAGYVRLDAYCGRGRTIYPYPPINGHNPSISANHFFVPGQIMDVLRSRNRE